MKYSTEITVNVSREEFIKKLDNIDNIKHWHHGLVSAEHISGTPGEIGAKMKLSYKFGKREMELVETITKRDFPYEFHATYDAKGMHNKQENFFEELADGKTQWTSTSEFEASSFMLRMMLFLMPSAFKKQSKKYMEDFKKFAENGTSVSQQQQN
jgi:hypothetical protein